MASLDQALQWRTLRSAWDSVARNDGAPGPDRISIARFAHYWGANLHTLAGLARTGRYRPGRLRRIAIPKRGGGERLLRIPNVGDRVLQRAVLDVLEPHFERVFLPCSHGYRPGRGVRSALSDLLALRGRGLRWVLDADIDDCFASIDHAKLAALLAEHVADRKLLALIGLWLHAGAAAPGRGLALGMPISPLLCNLYLHQLDSRLLRLRWPLVRYADDFVVCCASAAEAERARGVVESSLAELELRLEPSKTRVASFDEGFDFLGIRFKGDAYSFTWEDKRFTVEGPLPRRLWGYAPEGYDG